MRLRFWGTRGSIATPGPTTLRYGGNTSCVEVESDGGALIVLDCGTGAAPLGAALMQRGKALRGHLLISHSHWDHIQGVPFFAPLFVPGNEWDIYAPHGFQQSIRETLAGQMQHTYFPVDLEQLGATIRYHDLTEGVFAIDDVTVTARYLNHPALTLGYRLESGGISIVYSCDHEPHSRATASGAGEPEERARERAHVAFAAGTDLVIHDAQYRATEYAQKVGWGHSTLEYAVAIAEWAEAKALALTHHDPRRGDDELDRDIEGVRARLKAKGSALTVFAAAEGQELEWQPRPTTTTTATATTGEKPGAKGAAELAPAPQGTDRPALLGVASASLYERLSRPLRADGITVLQAADKASVLALAASAQPGLIVLDSDLPGDGPGDGVAACRTLRAGNLVSADIPIILVASHEPADTTDCANDWLIEPFSSIYARARMRAWLMRTVCRWKQPPQPSNEAQRLAALHALRILDTKPEERFDRLTRIAAAAFDAPISLVTLVDKHRQWFKSACGGNLAESPRDVSFCAHAILEDQLLIVPDTLDDPRFADNPAVTGPQRIRFYAGCPLKLDNGAMIGTLCVADIRPRQPAAAHLAVLKDLAQLVLRELQQPASVRSPLC